MEFVASLRHKEGNRAAETALVVHKLITMDRTVSLTVAECFFRALFAQEVLRVHVFSCCALKIVEASKIYITALMAIVQGGLLEHILCWLVVVMITRRGYAA